MTDSEYRKKAIFWTTLLFVPTIVFCIMMIIDLFFEYPKYYFFLYMDVITFAPVILSSLIVSGMIFWKLWTELNSVLQRLGLALVFFFLFFVYLFYSILLGVFLFVFLLNPFS